MTDHDRSALIDALAATLGMGQVVTGKAIDGRYLRDWMVAMSGGLPLALVRPRTTVEVATVLRLCHARRVAVVPQGGLTGLVGGATPVAGCVVISLDRMSGIEEIDEAASTLTALAGTPLQTVQEAALAAGLFFPLDLGARGSCQIGGTVATNAGGNRVIRYGMARDLVLGLEVVLADGTVVTSLNKLIKNNAGLDLKQIFIGSEGTLGVITRVVVRLHPRPRSLCTAFCAVPDYDSGLALLRHAREALGGTLSAFEMMWPDFYGMVTTRVTGMPRPLAPGLGLYVLIESLGGDQDADQTRFESMLGAASDAGLIVDASVAQSAAEARTFWQVRDASGEFPRILWPNIGFDLGIPARRLGAYVDACGQALRARWPAADTAFFGHIGDSNLHLSLKVCEGDQPEEQIEALVYGLVRECGGTISAEHGIGLLKRRYLSYTRSVEELALMRTIKQALDPEGILNPGKIWG
ncbi:MAG: FAD-binding oxidoreductase [Vicinamibacterales bacterium]